MRSSMTRPRHLSPTIQQKLYAQIDIIAFTIACNFDPICEGGDTGMGPAGSAVLWNVLVELMGEAAFAGAVDVVPVP